MFKLSLNLVRCATANVVLFIVRSFYFVISTQNVLAAANFHCRLLGLHLYRYVHTYWPSFVVCCMSIQGRLHAACVAPMGLTMMYTIAYIYNVRILKQHGKLLSVGVK